MLVGEGTGTDVEIFWQFSKVRYFVVEIFHHKIGDSQR